MSQYIAVSIPIMIAFAINIALLIIGYACVFLPSGIPTILVQIIVNNLLYTDANSIYWLANYLNSYNGYEPTSDFEKFFNILSPPKKI